MPFSVKLKLPVPKATELMATPGAVMSGLEFPAPRIPREENAATVSVESAAATAIASGELPGEPPPSYTSPPLPAAATTTIPRSAALLAATASGSCGEE